MTKRVMSQLFYIEFEALANMAQKEWGKKHLVDFSNEPKIGVSNF